MTIVLHGFHLSVYLRIARLVLEEKGVAYERVEVNPFSPDLPKAYLDLHPFGRVPVLVHDGFALYETGAITRYIDRAFPGPALQPTEPRGLARQDQVLGVIDAYAYWPLVRQVFAQRIARPRQGIAPDEAEIAKGMEAAPKVLGAVETLASGDRFLVGPELSLADLHLAPMIAYFVEAPEGSALLPSHPKLAAWWARISTRPSMAATDPTPPTR
ncbi:MAG: glutathione S-transferase family protein [Alphaproteobacteria bacterium]|nr:glutathione S-transferase family protein [Alphaproteobacteria bacterium]